MDFKLVSDYAPTGDQPEAIAQLLASIRHGSKHNTLLGVTGSGKTFTVANVISQLNRPTLVLSHNKTLAAQLYGEFKNFFPENAVEYFVSYYDYYQPEAYLPSTDTYIEKDLSINDEIEKMRLSTTATLLSGRRDVIVVSSVSCLYGCGNPSDFHSMAIHIEVGEILNYKQFLYKLVEALYTRTERELTPATFRVTGDTIDIMAAFGEFGNQCFRVTFFDNEVESIQSIDPVTGQRIQTLDALTLYPVSLFVTTKERIHTAVQQIYLDLGKQIAFFEQAGRPAEAQRIKQRVEYDLEMIKELGYCPGIENYSRYFDGRAEGTRPFCLLDYFPQDYLMVIDESHVTLPQVHAMFGGDRARKENLVEYGFRLPAAKDNRPLRFEEFEQLVGTTIYVSATPADYELMKSEGVIVEQLIRPTGLVDPPLEVRITDNQIDDLLEEIDKRVRNDDKILVTTITKRMAEELSKYFDRVGVRNRYIHSDIDTLERVQILEDLRAGMFDVLIGVNLLREGLDLPEVALVAILDADKEGFLRNVRSITQIAGRAARHSNGNVILYADHCTDSMRYAIEQSNRRREKQMRYNMEHEMLPRQAQKSGSGQSTLLANTVQTPVTDGIIYPPARQPADAGRRRYVGLLDREHRHADRPGPGRDGACGQVVGLSGRREIPRPHVRTAKIEKRKMNISAYISELNRQYASGNATEHSYRPALKSLSETLLPDLTIINEPKRTACGAPDYILLRNDIPVAFIEAKDFTQTQDLAGQKENKEQFDRYKHSLDNIIFTDYLDFWLYEKGEFVDSVRLAEIKGGKIVAVEGAETKFVLIIERLGKAVPQRITSAKQLARIMAAKARLMADVIEKALLQDDSDSNLKGQMEAFKDILIHDITPKEFADVYAQTIVYGMFAARLHDTTPDTFSRHEAATLIPKTNPFLRQLFQNVAGYDLDDRISWIVDDSAEIFRAADMRQVMAGFGHRTQQTDPMIHFYEDFLAAYDPKQRKNRGVWYTPQAVVSCIVKTVDEILQAEFNLPMGLADTSKITVERSIDQSKDKRFSDGKKKETVKIHKVQLLDPATGTGTFLAEAVSRIHDKFNGQAGMWQGYVGEHLLPRLNGFELLMTSYTMAHLKLDWILTETGYKADDNERLRVFLTNSLEEHHKDTGTLFAQFLAREANGANEIKRNTPVMVVLGNPPYSGESKNKGEWIMRLMEDYKKEPDTNQPLKERNPKWINDDYCKFIRLGQFFVDRNNEGILAYVNNHSFIDNPSFRGMRWNLLRSFDKIYIIDLHGNSKKKEVAPDGGKDENVFDIQQGVSINIFVKTGRKAKNALAEVYHHDLYGRRETKYDYLSSHTVANIPFVKLQPSAPEYFFVPKNYGAKAAYDRGFSVTELFPVNSVGIVTTRDELLIKDSPEEVETLIRDFITMEDAELRTRYNIGKDSRDWSVARAKADIGNVVDTAKITPIEYRPFDRKYLYYTGKTTGIVARPRFQVMRHFAAEKNFGLAACRQTKKENWTHIFLTKNIIPAIFVEVKDNCNTFPLYTYPDQTDLLNTGRTPNLDPKIVAKIAESIGLEFEPEKSGEPDKFAPIDLLDYIYAVLHCPAYREKYREFLKADFPRVPYPENTGQFHRLTQTGAELRRLHLMENSDCWELSVTYPECGTDEITEVRYENEKVFINDRQYFGNVSPVAWNLFIGGYQPARKWLKDRIGKKLTFSDIRHYQKIIFALCRTDALMRTELNIEKF